MYIISKKIMNRTFIIAMSFGCMNISCKGHKGNTGSPGTADSLYKLTSLTCAPTASEGPAVTFTVVSTDTNPNAEATCQVNCTDIAAGPGQKGSLALSTYFPLPSGESFTLPYQACDGTTCKAGNNIDCTATCASTDGSFGVSALTTVCPGT